MWRPDFSYYIITGIDHKPDGLPFPVAMRDLVGQICYIGYLQCGEHAFINAVFRHDPTRFRPIRTSVVEDFTETPDGSVMHIETQNRIYHLRRASLEEIASGLSALQERPLTVPCKLSGQYGT